MPFVLPTFRCHVIADPSDSSKCCCREWYHPKQKPKPTKEAKKQRTVEAADAQLLDITETQRYQTLNPLPPAPVAEVIDLGSDAKEAEVFEDYVETPDELYDFFSAALGHEQQDAMEAFGDATDSQAMDLDAALSSIFV